MGLGAPSAMPRYRADVLYRANDANRFGHGLYCGVAGQAKSMIGNAVKEAAAPLTEKLKTIVSGAVDQAKATVATQVPAILVITHLNNLNITGLINIGSVWPSVVLGPR